MTGKIGVFYTGGGITLVEAELDEKHIAVVSSDAPEYIAVYTHAEDDVSYLPEDMVGCTHKDEMPTHLKALYAEMLNKLEAVA